MHDRNVLSLVKGFTGLSLISLASLVATPVLADGDSTNLLLSMLAPSPVGRVDNALTVHEVRPAPVMARTVDLTVQPDDLWLVPGYAIGAKTGTASIPSADGTYEDDSTIGSVVGLKASGFVSAVRFISAALPLARQIRSGARPMIE